MITLYVVDDEKYIRESLCHSINWDSYGVSLAGSAQSGLEAYEFLSNHEISIVLTDIRMPDMDGLELIRKIRMINHSTKFVILSGFNEFEYAQKAIAYGVSAYLLKPCAKQEIVNTVLSLSKSFQNNESITNIKRIMSNSSGKVPNALRIAVAYIEENYSQDITRETVANKVFMSSSYLSTLFRKNCLVGFNEYLNKVRIEHACEMLKSDSTLKVYEIAQKVGFKDEKYFSTVFRKSLGMSPTEYRSSMEEKK